VRALLRGLKTTGFGEHQQLLSAVVQQVFPNIKLFEAFTDSFLPFSHMYFFFIILKLELELAGPNVLVSDEKTQDLRILKMLGLFEIPPDF